MSNQATEPRIRIDVLLDDSDRRAALYDATFWSLRATPKELPAVWLYDETGSRLFEKITRLPEYYLTAAEREILAERAAEIAELTQAQTLVELGAGTSEKTLLLLDALTAADTLERFVPLDVSEETLRLSANTVADRYPAIGVHAIVGDFERHLSALPAGDSRLVAFLGSTVGNLYPDRRHELFAAVARATGALDWFLLGVDLVKEPAVIEAAYNDPGGVTERFVRNVLPAVNRDLHANFVPEAFAFESRWNGEEEWMDIGFRSLEPQRVQIEELEIELELAAGERLRIEISAKFTPQGIEQELAAAGLLAHAFWTDRRNRFGLVLARRAAMD
jgi:L-histidine N-alpha-methyltransferase